MQSNTSDLSSLQTAAQKLRDDVDALGSDNNDVTEATLKPIQEVKSSFANADNSREYISERVNESTALICQEVERNEENFKDVRQKFGELSTRVVAMDQTMH